MPRIGDQIVQVISGLGLLILGFYLLVTNVPYLLGLFGKEHGVVVLIGVTIGTLIALGGYLAAGYNPRKAIAPLTLGWTSLIFIIPIFYLPLPEDVLIIALGFSTFIPLLLWIAYAKLKEKITGKRETDRW